MIAANKKYLKANLTQGVLEIQTNLIELYTGNLSNAATQAAVIGGFAFTAITFSFEGSDDPVLLTLGYFYYISFTICFVSSLFVLTQATIVVMFGPTMALKGATDDSVKFAAAHMRKQQMKVLKAQVVTMSSLFFALCVYCWVVYDIGVAVITTIIFCVSFYYLVQRHSETYRIFMPKDQKLAFLEPVLDYSHYNSNKSTTNTNQSNKKANDNADSKDNENSNANAQTNAINTRLQQAQDATKFKLRAILWKRQSMEDGGLYEKYFAVLEKGRLDFYQKENDYRENLNPVNNKPVKMWQYNLETDARKYSKHVTNITTAVKSKLLGNEDFAMSDILSSDHDLHFASRNFKFGLVPKVQSELISSVVHELLAHDEKSYRLWINALSNVINGYDELAGNPSVEQTIRGGTNDVEAVVHAANTHI